MRALWALPIAIAIIALRRVLFHYSPKASDKTASAASVRRRNRSGSLGDVSKINNLATTVATSPQRSTARILHWAQVQVLWRLRSMRLDSEHRRAAGSEHDFGGARVAHGSSAPVIRCRHPGGREFAEDGSFIVRHHQGQ